MEKEISAKNTKGELLEAYNELLTKLQSKEGLSPKEAKETEEKKQLVKTASKNSYEEIVKSISGLKLGITGSLDQVEDLLLKEFKKLTQLQESIKIETANLENLYEIKANADSLSALLLAQKEKKQLFDDDMKEKKALWDKEQKEREILMKENEVLLKKQRTREEEEYTYNLHQVRKKETDTYNLQKAALEKELTDKRIKFEKEFADREQNIITKEAELAELRKKADTFPGELEKAIKLAETAVTQKLSATYKFEKELAAKELEGERKLKDQIIVSLEAKIKEQTALIAQLTSKADHATAQVKDIAVKAIEGSANVRFMTKEKEKKEDGQS